MLEPVRPGAVSPDRALCLPTFSHFLIVNKTSLSLSLSLSTMAVRMQALWSGGEAVKSKLSEVKRVKLHTGALVSGCKAEMLARLALWRSCLLSHFEAGPVCVCV
jgi:hypothetical protein